MMTPDQRERVEAAAIGIWYEGAMDGELELDDPSSRSLQARAALLATVAALVSEAVAAERARWEGMVADVGQLLAQRAHALRSAPPVDLASVQDTRFTGGLDPVMYVDRLREGTLDARPHPHTEEPQ